MVSLNHQRFPSVFIPYRDYFPCEYLVSQVPSQAPAERGLYVVFWVSEWGLSIIQLVSPSRTGQSALTDRCTLCSE